jgi:redox-sensitive bicupin YhaK (pirin superfamily)
MTSIREIAQVIEPQSVMEGAGVRLKRSIAGWALDYLDPFLLFDHFGSDNPSDYLPGFPMHPHRGIETVTYMLAGKVTHRDSLGNAGTIGAGDVQWMTAGRGIMHEEMPQPVNGTLRVAGFQLWVNLPAKLKMSRPRYQEYLAAAIPEARVGDGVRIRVVAGAVAGVAGPVTEIAADPTYLDIRLGAGVSYAHPVPAGHTAFAYLFEGAAAFGATGQSLAGPELIVFADGDMVQARAGGAGGRFLLVSGKPLGEPIARYGPFVMNTRQEILQALADLQNGTFVTAD